ncbi:hypothetical protein BGZ80_007244, partial [Entomortierella chlamydospora]
MSDATRQRLLQTRQPGYMDSATGTTAPFTETGDADPQFESISRVDAVHRSDVELTFNNPSLICNEHTDIASLADGSLESAPSSWSFLSGVVVEVEGIGTEMESLNILDSPNFASVSSKVQNDKSLVDNETIIHNTTPAATEIGDCLIGEGYGKRQGSHDTSGIATSYTSVTNSQTPRTTPEFEDRNGEGDAGHSGLIPLDGSISTKNGKEQDMDDDYKQGISHYRGEGVVQDYSRAFEFFLRAARKGCTDAYSKLGYMYNHGFGVAQNHSEAMKWYRTAASNGSAESQYNLGVMYEESRGMPSDYFAALKLYQKAANQGYARAQYSLGHMYERSFAMMRNYSKAFD